MMYSSDLKATQPSRGRTTSLALAFAVLVAVKHESLSGRISIAKDPDMQMHTALVILLHVPYPHPSL